jgi:hypothetical protein
MSYIPLIQLHQNVDSWKGRSSELFIKQISLSKATIVITVYFMVLKDKRVQVEKIALVEDVCNMSLYKFRHHVTILCNL